MRVDILETREDGSQVVIGSFELYPDGKIGVVGQQSKFLLELVEGGIWNRLSKKPEIVTEDNGELFLKNLRFNFTGSRIRATDVIE